MVYSIVLMHFHAQKKEKNVLQPKLFSRCRVLLQLCMAQSHHTFFYWMHRKNHICQKSLLFPHTHYIFGSPFSRYSYLSISAFRFLSLYMYIFTASKQFHELLLVFRFCLWNVIFGPFVGICVMVLFFRSIEDAHKFVVGGAYFRFNDNQNPITDTQKCIIPTVQIEFGWMVFNCQKYIKTTVHLSHGFFFTLYLKPNDNFSLFFLVCFNYFFFCWDRKMDASCAQFSLPLIHL